MADFYSLNVLPGAQPTVSVHWRNLKHMQPGKIMHWPSSLRDCLGWRDSAVFMQALPCQNKTCRLCLLHICVTVLLYLCPHGVMAGGILFYCRSFFLSVFFFRQRISEMALPTAQKVGYRCNFIKLVQNLGANPPLEFGGPKTTNFGQFSDDLQLRRSTAPERKKDIANLKTEF